MRPHDKDEPPPRRSYMRRFHPARTMVALLLLALAFPAMAQEPQPPAALAKLEVFPPDISLTTARDRQLVVVQATFADGLTRDVTAEATLAPANPGLVRREGNTFWPAADGETA